LVVLQKYTAVFHSFMDDNINKAMPAFEEISMKVIGVESPPAFVPSQEDTLSHFSLPEPMLVDMLVLCIDYGYDRVHFLHSSYVLDLR